jgi:signal recognition particle GTPase
MGILFTKLWNRLLGDQEVKIVIVGLDNAGKTTTLYKLYVCMHRVEYNVLDIWVM